MQDAATRSRRAKPRQAADRDPLVWVLLGARRGDNNQLLALAGALGFGFEAKAMTYNQLRRVPFFRRARLTSVTLAARRQIGPPWPDLVIGAGYDSLAVARYIRRQSFGATRIVQIGNPRGAAGDIDLLITTPQYPRAPASNVLTLPMPMSDPAAVAAPSYTEEKWLARLSRPLRLIAIGGPARNWEIDTAQLGQAMATVMQRSDEDGGTLIVATSPRTGARTKRIVGEMLGASRYPLVGDFPKFATLLAASDEIHVTADSVSMLSEAILTGKPVGMIPIRRSPRGVLTGWLIRCGALRRYLPDFPGFWHELRAQRLVGTVARPVASEATSTLPIAAAAVLRLLADKRKMHIASE
jgi:mitochondrial fission protein ELM1